MVVLELQNETKESQLERADALSSEGVRWAKARERAKGTPQRLSLFDGIRYRWAPMDARWWLTGPGMARAR